MTETKQIELTLADNTGMARAIISEGFINPDLLTIGNKIALRNAKTKYIDNKLVIIINKWGCISDENNTQLFEGESVPLSNEGLNISEKIYDYKNTDLSKISPNQSDYNILVKVIDCKPVVVKKEESKEN